MHKLLQRQLRQSHQASPEGSPDLDTLLALIDAAYHEIDRERRFTAHAHQVLRDEYAALTSDSSRATPRSGRPSRRRKP